MMSTAIANDVHLHQTNSTNSTLVVSNTNLPTNLSSTCSSSKSNLITNLNENTQETSIYFNNLLNNLNTNHQPHLSDNNSITNRRSSSISSNTLGSNCSTNTCCDHKQIIRNQLSRIESLELELNSLKCERDLLLAENEKLCFQMQMLSECYNDTKRNFADLQSNANFISTNASNIMIANNNRTSSEKLNLNASLCKNELNNNNLNETPLKDEQNKLLNENNLSIKKENENGENINLLNVNNFNNTQKSNFCTLNSNSSKTVQTNMNSQITQYELKPSSNRVQYELSQEMLDKHIEFLQRKYGENSWSAAMLIQRFWRKQQMSKRFQNIASGGCSNQSKNNFKIDNSTIKISSDNELNTQSDSTNDTLELSGINTSDQTISMDLMEVPNTEIIVHDAQCSTNGNTSLNESQQKLINATLQVLKTPLGRGEMPQTSNSFYNSNQNSNLNGPTNRFNMHKRLSNASLHSTSSSASSNSNNSIPRSPTMPSLQKNIFYNNANSVLSTCSSAATNGNSQILLNNSPIHSSNINPMLASVANGTALAYTNGVTIYNASTQHLPNNVCLNNLPTNAAILNGSLINPYYITSPSIQQPSLPNAITASQHFYHLNNSQLISNSPNSLNSSAMSLGSCLSNNTSRVSLLSTISRPLLVTSNSQQFHHQQLQKQQQLQISQYETIRKRQYRVGLSLFNKKPPERGIQYLIENGFIDVNLLNYAGFLIDGGLDSGLGSLSSCNNSNLNNIFIANNNLKTNENFSERTLQLAAAVTHFLLTRKGLSKQMIGEYLGNLQQPFNQLVLKIFVKQMDLTGLLIDVALRKFQTYFRFPGEAQKIERLVEVFSERYFECNFENGINPALIDCYTAAAISAGRNVINNETINHEEIGLRVMTKDEIFILSFAIIMLNTDLHIPNNKRRMTEEQWLKNLKGVFKDGGDLDETFLLDIYERIKQNEFKTGHDHCNHVLNVQKTLVASSSSKPVPNLCLNSYRRLVCFCRLYEILDLSKKTTKAGQHQREVFLFNDMLLVTKLAKASAFSAASSLANAGGHHSASPATQNQYLYRRSILLSGCSVSLFSTDYYPYGIKLSQKTSVNQANGSNNSTSTTNNKTIIMFNARNDIDRNKFYEDLKESIAEITEMEMIRISSTNGFSTAITSSLSSNISSSCSTSSTSSSCGSFQISSSSNCAQVKTNTGTNSNCAQFSPTHSLQNKSNSLLDLVYIQ